jgi:organic hydroperoxide reductase OsmC/OhrA
MPREHLFQALTTWTGAAQGPTSSYEAYSREYTFAIEGKPTLTGSAAVPYRGDASLPNPEDLLLAAVSACHLLSYLAECARAGVQVVEYEDQCTATMTFKDGKMRIVEATLRPRVKVAQGTDLDKAESLHQAANEACFIANSVNFPIHHYPEVTEAFPTQTA